MHRTYPFDIFRMPLVSKRVLALTLINLALCVPPVAASADTAGVEWKQLQKNATDALDANKYWLAEPMLKQAVIKAGGFGEADVRLAKSLGELGRLYTVRGKFDEAEPYLEEELRVKEEALGKENPEIIPAMGSLVQFYLKYGTVSKAEPLTEEMLAFVEGKLQEAGAHTGKLKAKKGVPLEGWVGEAAPVAIDPLVEWAVACDACGDQYKLRDNFELADRLYKAALDMKMTVFGKQHLSLANSYDSLGDLCVERNDDAGAITYYRDSLAMTEKILPPDNPKVYSRLDKLAKALIKSGNYKEAEDLYIRAQGFWKEDPGTSGDECRALYALGSLYTQEKNYEAAAPVLQKALDMAEQLDGPASIGLLPYLQRYAYALYYLNRKPEVEQLHARISTISGGVQ